MSTPAIDAALRSGPNPFEDRVVHNTRRDDVPDAREIHAPIRERIQRAIDTAGTKGLGSFLVIGGQVGRGKTREALSLPPEERAALAAKLIESLDGEVVDDDAEAAWAAEIERRVNEIKAGTARTIPWEQARARIQQARDARRKG